MTHQTSTRLFGSLNQEIATCPLCDLANGRTRAVPGEGDENAEVMFIGEGPGYHEDQQGRPFVGRAGQFLDSLIELIGLRREDVYITNVVKCRPPGNRDPLPSELAACHPYLMRQITLVNPRVIVTLGRHSLGTFFPGESISRVHGTLRKKADRNYFAMYHPAAALHQERYRQTIIDDMKKLGAWLVLSRESQSQLDLAGGQASRGAEAGQRRDEDKQLPLF